MCLPQSVSTGPGYRSGLSLAPYCHFQTFPPYFPLKKKQTNRLPGPAKPQAFQIMPPATTPHFTNLPIFRPPPFFEDGGPASLPFSPLPPPPHSGQRQHPQRTLPSWFLDLLTPNGLILYCLQLPALGHLSWALS